jgi:hypothetical protein
MTRFSSSLVPLDQRQIYRVCCGLLVVTALNLLWDDVSDYLLYVSKTWDTRRYRSESKAVKASQTSEGLLPNSMS